MATKALPSIAAGSGGLARYLEEIRKERNRETLFEWFQWLAEKLDRHSQGKTNLETGAQVAYRDWKP